jgi:hypothetical protein
MSEVEWVDAFGGASVADESWLHSQNGSGSHEIADPVRIVTLSDFISVQEDTAEPLLGSQSETILPADGMLLMYGDGGAGKTTLTVDMAAHLGSGTPWLGIEVPRPVTITLIENEGPRGKFRQMLSEKTASWDGASFTSSIHVLEEPWTRFTLQDEAHRQGLSSHITNTNTDVVVMGPLATLGMVGGGTPDEISVFERLLGKLRELLERPISFWIVHHENKQGDVSGAWERVPDTLCHVQARGNGHTTLHWRKARWSSEKHGTSVDLVWTEGRSFETVEKEDRDPWVEMLEAFRKDDEWRTAKEAGKLIEVREKQAKQVLAELVRRGEMVYEKGPSGRHGSAHCWRLKGALMDLAHLGAPWSETSGLEQGAPCAPPVRGAAEAAHLDTEGEAAPGAPSAPSEDDDGIPF